MNIVNGEFGINVQGGGNFDLRVDTGKLQMFSGSDFTANTTGNMVLKSSKHINATAANVFLNAQRFYVNCSSTIELKVGNNFIRITSAGIQIYTSNGPIDIFAGPDGTTLQGGGPVAPPTTFK
jgi:hypothetical protein